MLYFNDLYIDEEGKHLVIDVEIEGFDVYDSCYIDTITVDTAEDYCEGGKAKAVDVYKDNSYTTYLDIDGDGEITDKDCQLYNRLNELISKLEQDEDTLDQYDVDRDGIVSLKDLTALIYHKLGIYSNENYHYDINNDGESVNDTYDMNALIGYFLELADTNNLTAEEKRELEELLGMYSAAVKLEAESPQRHVRLCLSWCDLPTLLLPKESLANHMFVVTATASCDGSIGEISKELGCGWDNNVITGVAVNTKPLYNNAVNLASGYGDSCDTASASAFEDFILRYYAFDFALKLGDICQAWYYYKNYLLNGSSGSSSVSRFNRGCGCHGARW